MQFSVKDMTCGHCKAAIEKAVTAAGGRAEVDLENHRVTVTDLDQAKATEVIREAGYTPEPA